MRNGRIKYFSILGVVLFLYLTTSVYSLLICTYILLILPNNHKKIIHEYIKNSIFFIPCAISFSFL